MLSLHKAIERCIDRCNLDLEKDEDCIIKYMYQYKAIFQLSDERFDDVYEEISRCLGLMR